MTVNDLIKRLEKIDKNKVCLYRPIKDSLCWANFTIKEKENEVTFYIDPDRPFTDGG